MYRADYTQLEGLDLINKIGVLLTIEIRTQNNFYVYGDNALIQDEEEILFNEGLTFTVERIEKYKVSEFYLNEPFDYHEVF